VKWYYPTSKISELSSIEKPFYFYYLESPDLNQTYKQTLIVGKIETIQITLKIINNEKIH